MTADLPIESLRNLGPKSGQWLREAGITTIAELAQELEVTERTVYRDLQALEFAGVEAAIQS